LTGPVSVAFSASHNFIEEISLLAFEHPSKGYVDAFALFATL
jgi:hypothetical protein